MREFSWAGVVERMSGWGWRERRRGGRALGFGDPTLVIAAIAALATAGGGVARAVNIEMVPVGNPGNAADDTGFGAVSTAFQMGKYEITIGQYTEFLNTVAKSDPYGLWSPVMQSNLGMAGIARAGVSGSYTYTAMTPSGVNPPGASSPTNRPISSVSWFDAARFANWMHNGQGRGSTEEGAYRLVNGQTAGTAPARNARAQYFIPTENEWYKAAFYKGGSTNAGYWDYATQSNTAPGNVVGSAPNQANYLAGSRYSVTQSTSWSSTQNYITDAGAFSASASAYGTYDMSGNVWEWTDLTGAASTQRGLRGGHVGDAVGDVSVYGRRDFAPNSEFNSVGFRLASPVAATGPVGDTVRYQASPGSYSGVTTGLNLEYGTTAFPPLTETTQQFYRVEGNGPVTLNFRMHVDTGSFNFSFGFYKHTAALDAIDVSTTAGKRAFAEAALGPTNAVVVFDDRNVNPGATATATLSGGELLGFFLIPDGTLGGFQTNPGSFAVDGFGAPSLGWGGLNRWPLFGYSKANPGGMDQLMSFSGISKVSGRTANMFAWEDLTRASFPGNPIPSDSLFNDLVFGVEGVQSTSGVVVPEVDPASAASVAAIVIGILGWSERWRGGGRRRLAP